MDRLNDAEFAKAVAATKRRQDRRLRLKTLHVLAAMLVEDLNAVTWETEDLREPEMVFGMITGIAFTLTVDHNLYWRTYARVAKAKGWSLTQG